MTKNEKILAVAAAVLNVAVLAALAFTVYYVLTPYHVQVDEFLGTTFDGASEEEIVTSLVFQFIDFVVILFGGFIIDGILLIVLSLISITAVCFIIVKKRQPGFLHIAAAAVSVIPTLISFLLAASVAKFCPYSWLFAVLGFIMIMQIAANALSVFYRNNADYNNYYFYDR